ncbi:MAG TPA: ABC transporter permease [Kineosporiaceae bacterium]|nr:ABC transporter permease [Kineosporiaceae bacterium]
MAVPVPLPAAAPDVLAPGRLRGSLSVLRRPDVLAGLLIILFFAVCAVAPGLVSPRDPLASDPQGLTLLGEPLPPLTDGHVLGTDVLGRDHLARLVHGARVAVLVAVVPNLLALVLATLVGVTAGLARGAVELVLMRVTESIMVLPAFLIAMAVIATFGSSTSVIVLTLVAISWTYPARVVYGETLRLASLLYVEAARSMGAGGLRIAIRHVVPHLRPLLVVYFTMNAAFMVLLEAGLGFLGFGVQPPTPSWGLMLAEARDQFFYPWLILAPGACLAALCVGFYLVGQGLQRAGQPPERRVQL